MKNLYGYEDAVKMFVRFLTEHNFNTSKILTSDFIDSLGYIITFLNTEDIYIVADNYNILVYTCGRATTNKGRHYAKENKTYFIYEKTLEEEGSVLDNYFIAIDNAFDFLNVPF